MHDLLRDGDQNECWKPPKADGVPGTRQIHKIIGEPNAGIR